MGLNIVASFLTNALLLLGLSFIYEAIYFFPFKNLRVQPVLHGFLVALICVAIMNMPFTFQSGIILDTRSILISVTALLFSPVLTVITVVVAILFRLSIGGVGMLTGFAVAITSALIGMAWRRWLYPTSKKWRWLNIYAMSVCVHLVMLACMFLLPHPESLKIIREITMPVLLIYPIVTVLLSLMLIHQKTLRHIQDQLKESEERFQRLFDKAPLGYQSLDRDGNFIEVNQQWCDLLGYSRDEVLGTWFGNYLSPEHRESFRQGFPIFKAQGYIHREFELLHASGKRLIVSFEGKIEYGNEGEFKQTHCILQDVTKQKSIEMALVENEKKFRNITENMSDVVWQTDIHLKTLYISPSVEKLLGETAEAYLLRPLEEKFSVQTLETIRASIYEEVIGGHNLYEEKGWSRILEVQQYTADGSAIWIAMNVSAIRDEQGLVVGFQGVSRDITQRKIAEIELLESERSKSVLLSNLPGMAYRCNYDRAWTMQFVSAGCLELTGYASKSLINNRDLSFLQAISPEYHEPLWQEWERVLADRKPFTYEYEIITAEGDRKWVMELGEGVFYENGVVEALEGIIIDISDLKKLEKELKYTNEHDFWTDLHNLRYLVDILSFEKRNTDNGKTALVGIDLSAIHLVEIAYGFRYAQDVIKKVADALKYHCTATRQLFHLYENQFGFYVKAYSDRDELRAFSEEVAATLESVLSIERVGGGIGVVEIDERNIDLILRNLMVSFENTNTMISRDFGFCFYGKEMETHMVREQQIELELSQIAANENDGRLFLQFQPILDLSSNTISGFEALARLNSEAYGSVSPIEFIPIAEKTKLIIPLGRQIILQAFRFLNTLHDNGYEAMDVAINISAIQLLENGFVKNLIAMMNTMHINPTKVGIEITESIFATNYLEINEILGELKALGITIAIDDFGTGYSSLARERELNVNCLKIDRSFIVRLLSQEDGESLIGDIITMAHRMGHFVIAEGVEEETQLQYLKDHDCDKIQGYLIARPLDIDAACEMLTSQTSKHSDNN